MEEPILGGWIVLYTLLQSDKTDVLPTLELDCLFVTPISFLLFFFYRHLFIVFKRYASVIMECFHWHNIHTGWFVALTLFLKKNLYLINCAIVFFKNVWPLIYWSYGDIVPSVTFSQTWKGRPRTNGDVPEASSSYNLPLLIQSKYTFMDLFLPHL